MKNDMRLIVGVMIAVILAGGIFLWYQGQNKDDVLDGLDPESFDVEATCIERDRQYLICNGGNDTFVWYEDVEIFLLKLDTVVKENGDEVTNTAYEVSSIGKLEKMVQKSGAALMRLWLNERGQIEKIMLVESTYTNNNLSLENMEGLDPMSYNTTNILLSVDGEKIKLAPATYTEKEKDKYEEFISEYSFAEEVGYYMGTVTFSTDETGQALKNTQYSKLTSKEVMNLKRGQIVHIWFNEDGQVSNILVHNEVKK